MQIDITLIFEAIITLVCAVITAFLVPFIRKKFSVESCKEVEKWVKIAVEAAEMIYNGTGRGAEKKEYVLNFLAGLGYSVDMQYIDNLIESAVLELKRSLGE